MRLGYKDIISDLERTVGLMKKDNLNIGIVANISDKTCFLGTYFSENFNCDKISLPSLHRPGKNHLLAYALNTIYPFFPECILKNLSEHYKTLYKRDNRILKAEFDFNGTLEGHKSMLLVDDNAFTGKTLENWKKIIGDRIKVHTFSITITGDYKPDYFCLEGWKSFEWRPIGI